MKMGTSLMDTGQQEVTLMPLSITPKMVTFTSNDYSQPQRSRREQVETAATVTGGVGAGAAATRGGALKFFKSADKFNAVTKTATEAAQAVQKPAQQTRSLMNAFKINYKNFTKQIAEWAEASKMPKFMKGIFTGKLGKVIGKGAAVFVFITGIGEVFSTLLNNMDKVGVKLATSTHGN